MAIDHGILNLPLSKRGNFHKELDEYIAAEKQQKTDGFRSAAASFNELKAKAKEMLSTLDDDLIREDARRRGIKPAELKKLIRELCSDSPKKALIVMKKFQRQEAV